MSRINRNSINYFKSNEKYPIETYYHYTTLESFYNIIQSRTFWLTSLNTTNDKKEMYYPGKEFLKDLQSVARNERDPDLKKWFQKVDSSLKAYEKEFFQIGSSVNKQDAFALSLCDMEDNLSHWERYTNKCTGICIGINLNALKVLFDRENTLQFGRLILESGRALYGKESIQKYIADSLADDYRRTKLASEEGIKPFYKIFQENSYLCAMLTYTNAVKFIKGEAFYDENEMRLFHDSSSIQDIKKLIIDPLESRGSKKQYRKQFDALIEMLQLKDTLFYCSTERGIRAYKKLYLGQIWGSGLITSVKIGPLCRQNKKELRGFLNANGLIGTKITKSKVSIQ